jgi:hypothetical protein
MFLASVMETPGMVVGMYNRSPSFNGGMNSDPNLEKGYTVTTTRTTASTMAVLGNRSTPWRSGR